MLKNINNIAFNSNLPHRMAKRLFNLHFIGCAQANSECETTSNMLHLTAMFLVTSPIVIIVPTRGLLAVETMHAIVQWLANLNIKRNMTSMFVNKKHRYKGKRN